MVLNILKYVRLTRWISMEFRIIQRIVYRGPPLHIKPQKSYFVSIKKVC